MATSRKPGNMGALTEINDYSNWIFGALNREVDIVATSGTVDTATYKNPDGTTEFVIATTYADSTHAVITQIKRTT